MSSHSKGDQNLIKNNLKGHCFDCRCVSDVGIGLSQLLAFIGTVKGLAAIKDEVWLLLKEVSGELRYSDIGGRRGLQEE